MDKDILQHSAYPFGPEPEPYQLQLFNQLKPSELGGYLPPVETIQERRGRDPRGLGGKQLKEFWAEIYSVALSLSDLYPFRVVVSWRIIREWATQIGVVETMDMRLRDACNVIPSPWTYRKLQFGVRIPNDAQIAGIIRDSKGLCFLPPGIPESASGRDDYMPTKDVKLKHWCSLVEYIGSTRLALGTTQKGRYGLAGLTDPNFARLAMPSPAEIYAFEDLVVRMALQKMVEDSNTAAMDFLRQTYGLFDHEVQQIMAMAQESAVGYSPDNPTAKRALLMMRLEKVLHDCHERMDTRAAILTIREMVKLSRLDQTAGGHDVDGMVQEAQLVNSQRNPKKLLPPPPVS